MPYQVPEIVRRNTYPFSPAEVRSSRIEEQNIPMVSLLSLQQRYFENRGAFKLEKPNMYLRIDEARKLLHAAEILQQYNPEYTLFIRDAWRPKAEQEHFFQVSKQKILEKIAKGELPSMDSEELYAEITKFVADPELAFHMGGGALDVSIIDQQGRELNMGINEETLWEKDVEGTFYDERDSPFCTTLGEEVFSNRMLLARVMTEAGFTMQAEEWWHFDGADRAYSLIHGTPSPYGNLETEEDVNRLIATEAETEELIRNHKKILQKKRLPAIVHPRIYILDFQKDQPLWDAYARTLVAPSTR